MKNLLEHTAVSNATAKELLCSYDAIIIGGGLTGGVIARYLAEEKNKRILIIERRNHVGGNMYDYIDENGILVQKYGPHVFHTTKKYLYDYMEIYSNWEDFYVTCMAEIDGKCTPSPFNFQTIDDFYPKGKAQELKEHIKNKYGDLTKQTIVELLNCDDKLIKEYADFLYEKDYSLYTAKQWGISPNEIDISVLNRVPVLFSYKNGYFDDEYQKMPKDGFAAFFKNLLDHSNISVCLGLDACSMLRIADGKTYINDEKVDIPIVYTGAIDKLLNNKYGDLPYRSLEFKIEAVNTDSYQDAPIVAYPQAQGYTRITEYTKMPVQNIADKSVIAIEYPKEYIANKTEPYYPILTKSSKELYQKYNDELSTIRNLYLCGRLADFKYYNMDQALENALNICQDF